MNKLYLLVIGMGIVTYIPRMLPLVLLQNAKLPPFLNRLLGFIPYAALGALIFPGILTSTADASSAIAGMIAAVGLALARANLLLVVLAGIAGALVWQMML